MIISKMSDKKVKEGECAICGTFGKLSFEHVPPHSAFNNKPILTQNYINLTEESSYLYGKKSKSNKGTGGYTLCLECNNHTGDWYAKDFGDFAHQGMTIIKALGEPQYFISGDYQIKPLNVIKQILSMFMSVDKAGNLRRDQQLVDFILNKKSVHLPNKYKVFLYSTLSKYKRMMGYQIVQTPDKGIQYWSEINFQPFGYLLAIDSEKAHEDMLDISEFGSFEYDELIPVKITTAYLNVNSPYIGIYE